MVGQAIGNYRVLRHIGEGGMGAVYLAEHTIMGRRAAIKVLLPEFARRPEALTRFFNEAKNTARVRHPAIVEVLDCGTLADGSPYLVMEFLEGETLGKRIERLSKLSVGSAVDVGRQIAAGMSVAHRATLVHRDLKPENVFLVADAEADRDVVRILDFGIAKLMDGGSPGITHTGAILGTPLFMSPEQCRGTGIVDNRADIYSLGCILFAMLSGRPPFAYEGLGELMAAHLTETAPSARQVNPDVTAELDAVIVKMMAKDPSARFQTMADAMTALTELDVPAPTPRSMMIPPPEQQPPQAPDLALESRHTHTASAPANVASGETRVLSSDPAEPRADSHGTGETKLLPAGQPLAQLGSAAKTTLGLSAITSASPRPVRRILLPVAGAAIIAVGGVALLRTRGPSAEQARGVPTVVTPSSPVSDPLPPRAAPSAPSYLLKVKAEPATALLSVDGAPGIAGTLAWDLRGDGEHQLTVEAPGYDRRTIVFSRANLPPELVRLSPSVSAPPPRVATPSVPPVRRATGGGKTVSKPKTGANDAFILR